MEGGVGVEVPSFFVCPISLEIMRDPVILSTGITYDRDSIEKWIFTKKRPTCPVTKQPVADCDLTPNHTLRRLVQAWCTLNASGGVERFPTPRCPVDKAQIAALVADAPPNPLPTLNKLGALVADSERNRRVVEATPSALDFLALVIKQEVEIEVEVETSTACDEALEILYSLQISEQGLLDLISRNGDFIESLTSVLRRGSNQRRAQAALILKSVISVIAPTRLVAVKQELFAETVRLLQEQISPQATKAALHILAGLAPWGRNRIRAVEAGAVAVLIELLLGELDKRGCEMVMVALDRLCGCAEGRAALLEHAAGIAVVSKRILRVSEAVSERAVKVLHSVCRFSATPAVVQEMMNVGAVAKLCLMVEVDCGVKAKEKGREILRLHSRVWRSSPCLKPQLRAFYPS